MWMGAFLARFPFSWFNWTTRSQGKLKELAQHLIPTDHGGTLVITTEDSPQFNCILILIAWTRIYYQWQVGILVSKQLATLVYFTNCSWSGGIYEPQNVYGLVNKNWVLIKYSPHGDLDFFIGP
ncbi:uncharacterized protein LACBIDRAFT_327944 [Laccaria bicolor S238N-H82]|uniref:Predicted protein n=1 Tax=Laccaria bicolor (strain S238N-H82 / ATCC MYA-4686) TaxID=486041 RepID=B0DDB0_LACBS|nr:uncharacterized protein LACBIDRAFT_327944 [Laccaria bicolor S238N-H82]EDR07582.1 predicted protein [Laccaria bicolor S238N-H82]|eukprot:XP_001881974.1 predicted protein [Laccaria bicolor S238N-H82]